MARKRRWALWGAALALVVVMLGLLWHLSMSRPRLSATMPLSQASDVSTLTAVRAILSRAPGRHDDWRLTLDPHVDGVARTQGRELVFVPTEPLAHDTTYTVRVEGLGLSWRFATGPRRVLYLAPDAQGVWQLHALAVGHDAPVQLTQQPLGVRDYAIAPAGDAIVYAAEHEQGAHDLWLMPRDGSEPRVLLACPEDSCMEAAWHPDGQSLIYERHDGRGVTLWIVGLDGTTEPLLWQGGPLAATVPRISADGRWLAALCAETEQMLFIELETGEGDLIGGQSGLPAAWHRERNALLMSHVQWQHEAFGVGLVLADLDEGRLDLLTGGCEEGDLTMEDVLPSWSPDGEWIAFGRRADALGVSSARQIWLMGPREDTLAPLRADPLIHYGAPHWSPDGTLLLYSRHHLVHLGAPEPLGVLELATGREQLLPVAGAWPAWLP